MWMTLLSPIALASSFNATLIHDSGTPVERRGTVPFVSLWQVLDPVDNLAVRAIQPVEFDAPVRIDGFAVYSFNPKNPSTKRVEILAGTSADEPGTPLMSLVFADHGGVEQGWAALTLANPITLPAGKYGIAFRGEYEFASYWAGNAPRGAGFVWARLNEEVPWFKASQADLGFAANMGLRIYGAPLSGKADGSAGQAVTEIPSLETGVEAPDPRVDEYVPGTRSEDMHILWRKVQPAAQQPAGKRG